MSVKVEFKTDNAAFAEGAGAGEIARILRRLASRVEAGEDGGAVMDVNGNTVGSWHAEVDAEDETEDEG